MGGTGGKKGRGGEKVAMRGGDGGLGEGSTRLVFINDWYAL